MRATAVLSLLSLTFSLSARAATYNQVFNYAADPQVIPQVGNAFSVEHAVSMADWSITSVQFVLTFNDNNSLTGGSGGINGRFTLGATESSPFVSFYPTDNSGSGLHTYAATFTGSSGTPGVGFGGLNPTDTWSLSLFDTGNNGVNNALVGWSLSITAVPEPINVALGVFGAVFAAVAVGRRLRTKAQDRT